MKGDWYWYVLLVGFGIKLLADGLKTKKAEPPAKEVPPTETRTRIEVEWDETTYYEDGRGSQN
jgi:hypothetical protein